MNEKCLSGLYPGSGRGEIEKDEMLRGLG